MDVDLKKIMKAFFDGKLSNMESRSPKKEGNKERAVPILYVIESSVDERKEGMSSTRSFLEMCL